MQNCTSKSVQLFTSLHEGSAVHYRQLSTRISCPLDIHYGSRPLALGTVMKTGIGRTPLALWSSSARQPALDSSRPIGRPNAPAPSSVHSPAPHITTKVHSTAATCARLLGPVVHQLSSQYACSIITAQSALKRRALCDKSRVGHSWTGTSLAALRMSASSWSALANLLWRSLSTTFCFVANSCSTAVNLLKMLPMYFVVAVESHEFAVSQIHIVRQRVNDSVMQKNESNNSSTIPLPLSCAKPVQPRCHQRKLQRSAVHQSLPPHRPISV